MNIYEMYGRLAEQQQGTEAARLFLTGLVLRLRAREIEPEQVVLLEGGGFRVDPKPDTEPEEE